MNTFSFLFFGHLFGDWVFQNDWMAKGKRRRLFSLPGLVHAAIYTACVLLAAWVSGGFRALPGAYLWLGGLVFVSHWLIDGTRLVDSWMRLYRQTDLPVVRLMVDQTLHLLVLAALIGVSSFWR